MFTSMLATLLKPANAGIPINKINLPQTTKCLELYLSCRDKKEKDICRIVMSNDAVTSDYEKWFEDFVKNNASSKKNPNIYYFYKNNKLVNTLLFDGQIGVVAYQIENSNYIFDKI
jgi:hypothetical protein